MKYEDILGYIVLVGFIGFCIYYYFSSPDKELKCVVSGVDGNKYCVRDRTKVQQAADLLAKVTDKCKQLVEYVYDNHADDDRAKRLKDGFNPKAISETLPTSTYTAYSENKGEKIAFCLNPKKKGDADELIDEHTLTFVAIHELAHVATKSIGHKSDFWQNFKFLLEQAKDAGIHEPHDYKNSPKEYCSMKIRDNPYYDA